MASLIGSIYRNTVTGNEWKIVKMKDGKITFEDMQGNQFDTVKEATGNYVYIGRVFTKTRNF